jgi:hypothetical protein
MSEDIYQLRLRNGGNLGYWLKNVIFVSDWLKQANIGQGKETQITAIAPDVLQQKYTMGINVTTPAMPTTGTAANTAIKSKMMKEETTLAAPQSIWWHGGMKSPHLHNEGKLYPLTQEQWGKFVEGAMKHLAKQLATAKNVSFDSFRVVSETVESIT